MKENFARYVSTAKNSRSVPRFIGDALFLGLGSSTEIWGQKGPRPVANEEPADREHLTEDAIASPVDEPAIVQALGLSDNLSIQELEKIRRSFAKYNHPDKHSAAQDLFEQRMKIANMIIDERIRSKR